MEYQSFNKYLKYKNKYIKLYGGSSSYNIDDTLLERI